MVFIWYLTMASVFGKDSSIIDSTLKRFQRKKVVEDVEDDFEFNEDELEVINVDVIK